MQRLLPAAVLLAGCLTVWAIPVAADDAPPNRIEPATAFRFFDGNGDQKLSKDEFLKLTERNPRLKGNVDLATQVFKRLDANSDGFLLLEEYSQLGKMQGGRPPAPPAAAEQPPTKAANGFVETPTAEQVTFFEKKIRPVLSSQCYSCHSATAEKLKGGLLLDTRSGLRAGGDSGANIVPGSPDKSLLIKALRHTDDDLKMPPKQKLSASVVTDFEEWVKMGAPDPRGETAGGGKTANERAIDIEKGRQFWAFQQPKKVAPPDVKDEAWAKTDVDRFLLAALEAKGLKPVADADPRTLVRRLYLDLTGLPPMPKEVEAFVAEYQSSIKNPQSAIEGAVDRLLASPHFGERWGRHWLDVARFAESTGKAVNYTYPHAWRYRDYVIASFNADKPYDEFIREQLAGDLLPASDPKVVAERLVATGFLALGQRVLIERDRVQFEMDQADEQIDTVTQAFLGITAACARCHDHKYDPIPQKDYYALAGIFRSTETCYGTIRQFQARRPADLLELPKHGAPAALPMLTPAERTTLVGQRDELQKQISRLSQSDEVRRLQLESRMIAIDARLNLYEKDGTPKPLAMGVREKQRTVDSTVFIRGEADMPGELVPRGLLQVVGTNQPRITSGSGRKELADWIASPGNPLTARVMVNRVWLHLFGRGLVPTPDNFGKVGQPPTHPELLDALAVEFMEDGWSVKRLIRRLVLTHAYRLGSGFDPQKHEADPDNALAWRSAPRRLDAEVVRDAMLAVSGLLDRTPPKGSDVARAGDGPVARLTSSPSGHGTGIPGTEDTHRSIYLPVLRDNLPEALALFDGADANTVVAERPSTTVPAQGLFLLNNPMVMRAADAAAEKLLTATNSHSDRVRLAYLQFYARLPAEKEVAAAEKFLVGYKQQLAADEVPSSRREQEAWGAFCHALFASAEFLYRN